MSILMELQQRQNQYLAMTGGVLALRESDDTYNDMNREMIKAFKTVNGTAFLGNINFYGERRQEVASHQRSIYTEYTGQFVYNFGYSFVVPEKDDTLEALVIEWNRGKNHTDGGASMVDAIMNRINELGGINFIWY